MRITAAALLLLLMAGTRCLAGVDDLDQFLRSVAAGEEVTAPLRADGELEVVTPETTRRSPVALIVRPAADILIQLGQPAMKLILLGSGPAYLLQKDATKGAPFPEDASFGDSDFTGEDLEPFRLSHYRDWRIADESEGQVTVTLSPTRSQYSLIVLTVDREKRVPLKALYYEQTPNNLTKMRRNEGYELIGRKWVPTRIVMETFKLRRSSTFTFRWAQNPTFPPELFDPAFLARPSNSLLPANATP